MSQTRNKPQSQIRLLFFSHDTLPFVRQDEDILKKHFDLKPFYMKYYSTIPVALLTYAKVFFWLLKNIRQCDGLFIRFADVYGFFFSIFARLFRKKLFVVVGGFDVTWVPEINFGTYHNKRSRFFTWFTLKTASKILPVCQALVYDPGDGLESKVQEQGINFLYPDIDSKKIIVVSNGYQTSKFKPNDQIKRTDDVLMVGNIKEYQTFKRKGADIFIELAKASPEFSFTLVGAEKEMLKQWTQLPPNLEIIPYVQQEDLPNYYQKAKIIMCLSLTEGMPNVLSEAMLCECVPMGLTISSIPEIIGDTGVLLNSPDIEPIQEGLLRALKMDGKKARRRIVAQYPLEAREKKLVQIIESEFIS